MDISSNTVSQRQWGRTETIDEKLEDYVAIQNSSVAFAFIWTDRVPIEDAFIQLYGQVVEQDMPQTLLTKIQKLLQRVFRYFHPKQKVYRQPGDEVAVDLIERGLDSDVKLGEGTAAAFSNMLRNRRSLAVSKCRSPLWKHGLHLTTEGHQEGERRMLFLPPCLLKCIMQPHPPCSHNGRQQHLCSPCKYMGTIKISLMRAIKIVIGKLLMLSLPKYFQLPPNR